MGRGMGGFGRVGKQTGQQGGARKAAQLPSEIRERLKAARELFRGGDLAGAAAAFGALSDKAHERGRHRMAVLLSLRAAGALARAGDTDAAVARTRTAATYGNPIQNQTLVGRRFGGLVARLRADHADAAGAIEAAALEALGVSKLPDPGEGARTVNRARRRMLPKGCPVCGKAVDLDEVEFDDDGADCPECAMPLAR